MACETVRDDQGDTQPQDGEAETTQKVSSSSVRRPTVEEVEHQTSPHYPHRGRLGLHQDGISFSNAALPVTTTVAPIAPVPRFTNFNHMPKGSEVSSAQKASDGLPVGIQSHGNEVHHGDNEVEHISHGTLMLDKEGRSKYLGPTAGSEWLKDVYRSLTAVSIG